MSIIRRSGAALAGVISLLGVCGVAVGADARLDVMHNRTRLIVSAGGRPVVEYRHGGVPFKPYLAKLYSPGGVQILRDSPRDHKHHHALMFALAVDEVDFWGEEPKCGSQKSQSITSFRPTRPDEHGGAGLVEELRWTEPMQNKTLLVERRTVDVVPQPTTRPVTLLNWQSRLSVPPGSDLAKLTGSHYFGLGIRFVRSMDVGGRFFNAGQAPGEVVRGTERLAAARWCAYTAEAEGKRVTVALFDAPTNPRHPNKMFTMTQPFAYLSATLNLWKEPVEVKAGRPLELRYGVAVWDGSVEPSEVESLYQSWASSQTAQPPTGE